MLNGTQVPAKVRKETYACAVANGGSVEWNFLFNKYRTSQSHTYLYALSATKNPVIMNKWLSYVLNATIVRPQDMVYVIRYISASNAVGMKLAWEFAERNWERMMSIARENNFHVQILT